MSWIDVFARRAVPVLSILLTAAMQGAAMAGEPPSPKASSPMPSSNGDMREEFVEDPIFGGRVYLQQQGLKNAQTVVFVHGIGDNAARDWNSIIPSISKTFHTIAFDLPGFGRSDKGNEVYSPKNYAKFVNWIVMTYAKGPVYLVGHSMGGAISLYMAAEHPDRVRRLVLVDAAGILQRTALLKFLVSFPEYKDSENPAVRQRATNLSAWLARAIERSESLARRFGGVIDETAIRRLFIEDNPTTISGAELMETDFSPLVPKVTAPTTLIWGERDQIAPLRTGQVLSALLPSAALVTIPEAGHVPMKDAPGRTLELIAAALNGPEVMGHSDFPKVDLRTGTESLRCEDQSGKTFSGTYRKIEILRCKNIELKNVVAQEITITDSVVSMFNTRVVAGETAITLESSELEATNIEVSGKIGFETSLSRLDLAGAKINTTTSAIKNKLTSSLVCSLCTVTSGKKSVTWHDVYELKLDSSY